MTLGTGIFLSFLFIGIIALFIATKDRWNWKKIILWPVITLISLAVIAGISYYTYKTISDRPKTQDSFWDISLNTTKEDIKFIKGEPTEITDKGNWVYKISQSDYTDDKSIYIITFRNDSVRYIMYFGSDWLSAPDLQGIWIKSNRDKLIEKFGKPSSIAHSADELERIISYEQYNVSFILKGNKVIAYGLYNPTYGPIDFNKNKEDKKKTSNN